MLDLGYWKVIGKVGLVPSGGAILVRNAPKSDLRWDQSHTY